MTLYPITPVPAPRQVRSDKWRPSPMVKRYRAFRDEVRAAKIEIPVPCAITFHMPMPPSWSEKKKRAHDGQPHTQTPDIDNLLKSLFDAVFEDDCHVWTVWPRKLWARQGGIEIHPLSATLWHDHIGGQA